mmetsp:Transcript_10259/g.32434  ORF Transcript_10259/g.32434 Transcript_10259/m.32434 type:complete len:178 (-) Transcript_10259:1492-2025(-)
MSTYRVRSELTLVGYQGCPGRSERAVGGPPPPLQLGEQLPQHQLLAGARQHRQPTARAKLEMGAASLSSASRQRRPEPRCVALAEEGGVLQAGGEGLPLLPLGASSGELGAISGALAGAGAGGEGAPLLRVNAPARHGLLVQGDTACAQSSTHRMMRVAALECMDTASHGDRVSFRI